MKKTPNIFTLESLITGITENQTEIGGKWIPARPEGFYSLRYRIKAAWLVFTGKADAIVWPGGQ